jgi:hypothetical protein
MNVYGLWSWVEGYQVFFELANSADCALKRLLDEDSLLRVDNLIIALLKFPINVNVLDVEAS